MGIFFRLLISLLCPIALGYFMLARVKDENKYFYHLERFSLAFILGIGGLTWLMFTLSFLGIDFDFLYFFLVLITITAAVYVILAARNRLADFQDYLLSVRAYRPSLFQVVVFSAIVLICLLVLPHWYMFPLAAWDGWAIYGFKSKALYLAKSVPLDFFIDPTKAFAHLDYPLLFPLVEAWVYTVLDSWNDQLVNIVFLFYFLSFLIIFYFNLRSFTNRSFALLFTFFLTLIPKFTDFMLCGYSDLALLVYYFVSLIYLLRWSLQPERISFLCVSAICSGLAAWTKNEGLAFCLINFTILVFLLFIRHKRASTNWRLVVCYFGLVMIIILHWMIFKARLRIPNDLINSQNISLNILRENLYRVPIIFSYFKRFMIILSDWNILWVSLPLIILLRIKRVFSHPALLILLSMLAYFTIWFFIYMITPRQINWHLVNSLERLLLQMVPLALFSIALLLSPPKENKPCA